jgi:hypothetical protein
MVRLVCCLALQGAISMTGVELNVLHGDPPLKLPELEPLPAAKLRTHFADAYPRESNLEGTKADAYNNNTV